MGAVSRQKIDGSWWFHGVVMGQPDFLYTEAQLETGVHFRDVAVLFAVRKDSVEDHGEGVGEEDNDADWTDMVMIMI